MNKASKRLWICLALTLLLTACGEPAAPPAAEDEGPTVNYEDYIQSVTDRKITDLISAAEASNILGYAVNVMGSASDSTVSFQSEDGRHTITLTLENMTRSDFDVIASNPGVNWTPQEGLGEAAYWDGPHTELIAYQNGYAVSMSVYNIADAAMVSIVETVLGRLHV